MASDYIYDWNTQGTDALPQPVHRVEVFDETLRDGIQSPSALDPPVEIKLEILRLMSSIGVDCADIGLPAASQRNFDDVVRMTRFIQDEKLGIKPCAAGRTVVSDVTRSVEASQASGVPLEIYTFIGSSPIRQYAEDWDLSLMVQRSRSAVRAGASEGLPVSFVTEDTIRANPDDLKTLFRAALDEGATSLCLCDTVGHATPNGALNLVRWTRSLLEDWGFSHVRIDWHGHNDRGLALANGLAAAAGGAQRIHGTAMGIGERVGNVAMDQLVVNLNLLGWGERKLLSLDDYCRVSSQALGFQTPINYPMVGRDAFRTTTGVHASAIIKAEEKGEAYLADRVYSGVPAEDIGRQQIIELGPMSGKSNALFWLKKEGLEVTDTRIQALLTRAKASDRALTDSECREALGE